MGAPSPRCTAEFKQKAAELYRKSDATYAEVARGLGRDPGGPSGWVKEADAAGCGPGGNPSQMAEQLRRPKRENGHLKGEDEMLLKAGALSASRQPWAARRRGRGSGSHPPTRARGPSPRCAPRPR